jgi:hypothetical protein
LAKKLYHIVYHTTLKEKSDGPKIEKNLLTETTETIGTKFARMVFVRFSMVTPHFVVILEKHGCHFLILIDKVWFPLAQ